MTVEVVPIRGIPEVIAGDDLGGLLLEAMRDCGLEIQDADVVVVTQKVVSKAEGRVVPEGPEGKAGWVARETRRIVARRGDLVVVETRHGFVCANAGVDASNVGEGLLSLLPEDSDATAERIRSALISRTGADVAVVVTDTFGRAWRHGVLNVAIGCAGLPSLVDLRGTKDATGRVLDSTIVALADEVAAASGLVMGKADGVPAAIVRGLRAEGPTTPARSLVRGPDEDLFRESPLQAIHARRQGSDFGPGEIPDEVVHEALLAAKAAPGPRGTPERSSWIAAALVGPDARAPVVAALRDPASAGRVQHAALMIALFVPTREVRPPLWGSTGRDSVLLAAGAAVENLLLALHAQGLASSWITPADLDVDGLASSLGLGDGFVTGVVLAGWPQG